MHRTEEIEKCVLCVGKWGKEKVGSVFVCVRVSEGDIADVCSPFRY